MADGVATGSFVAVDRAAALLTPAAAERATRRRGWLDTLAADGAAPPANPVQRLMLSSALPRVYERWWRPAWGRVARGPLGPSMQGEHDIAAELLAIEPGDAVLDLACGTGNFTRRFAQLAGGKGLVVGADLSESMLDRAVIDTARAGLDDRAAYVRGDAADLPFLDATFDSACCFAGLNLMDDPHEAIGQMARVLVPGGRIALFTSARLRSPLPRLAQAAAAARSGMTFFEPYELTDALEALGFTGLRVLLTGSTQFVGGVAAA